MNALKTIGFAAAIAISAAAAYTVSQVPAVAETTVADHQRCVTEDEIKIRLMAESGETTFATIGPMLLPQLVAKWNAVPPAGNIVADAAFTALADSNEKMAFFFMNKGCLVSFGKINKNVAWKLLGYTA